MNNRVKFYTEIALESFIGFYLATFCMGLFFIEQGSQWLFCSILMGLLYAFVIYFFGNRLLKMLTAPALMIIIPIAPLLVLIIILSLLPIIQKLHL